MLNINHWVEKSNTLNQIRECSMSLRELRFFSVYLSRINSRDEKTRVVRFSVEEFQSIMELSFKEDRKMSKIKAAAIKDSINSLLSKVVNVPTKTGGLLAFQLFKRCRIEKDSQGKWFVEIDAHDDALPYMFDYKDKYFKYELWNALRLRSVNQLRMYEILKQYEKAGELIIAVEKLRAELFITSTEYKRFGDFKVRILDGCRKALAEQTDIKYSYEVHKRGVKGTILELKFIIEKNTGYTDQINIDEYIVESGHESFESERETGNDSRSAEIVNAYRDLNCGERFGGLSDDEILELNQRAFDYLMNAGRTDELGLFNQAAYVGKQALYTNRKKPKNFYSYLVKAVGKNYAEA